MLLLDGEKVNWRSSRLSPDEQEQEIKKILGTKNKDKDTEIKEKDPRINRLKKIIIFNDLKPRRGSMVPPVLPPPNWSHHLAFFMLSTRFKVWFGLQMGDKKRVLKVKILFDLMLSMHIVRYMLYRG